MIKLKLYALTADKFLCQDKAEKQDGKQCFLHRAPASAANTALVSLMLKLSCPKPTRPTTVTT